MFGLGPATKIYVAAEAVDMRKGFRGIVRLGTRSSRPRPAERASISVHEPHAHEAKSDCVGWERTVGVREAAGAWAVPLATNNRRRHGIDAVRRTGDAGEWNGCGASAATTQLAPSSAGSVEHF